MKRAVAQEKRGGPFSSARGGKSDIARFAGGRLTGWGLNHGEKD